jgi:transaldolase
MKLFLDTAHIESIKKYIFTGLIDGVTTNPTHLSKQGNNPQEVIKEIQSLLPNRDISVEITEKEPQAVYTQARAIADLGENIVVKIPCHADYFGIIHQLVSEGISLNITLVFSLMQGLFMSKLGVRYISPFVGRLDDMDVDGILLLHQLRDMIDYYGFETELLAASLRSVRHLHESIVAGADVATLPVELLEKSMNHVLTQQGIELFDADWKKSGIRQFP